MRKKGFCSCASSCFSCFPKLSLQDEPTSSPTRPRSSSCFSYFPKLSLQHEPTSSPTRPRSSPTSIPTPSPPLRGRSRITMVADLITQIPNDLDGLTSQNADALDGLTSKNADALDGLTSQNADALDGLITQIRNDLNGLISQNTDDLDGLISHISQLLKLIEAGNKSSPIQRRAVQYLPTTSKSFSKLKAKDIIPSDAIKTVVNGVLLGMGIGHMVTTSFVVVANLLERFEEFGDNKTGRLSLLKEMFFLAKLVKQFQERPTLKESEGIRDVIKEATGLIVEGSVLCCTQMKSSKFSNFWKAPAMKEEMSKFRQKLMILYTHMNALMGIRIYDINAPKKPRLSRKYPEHAVGIDGPIKEVHELLEWKSDKNAVAVVLLGIDGIGKTTLGDAVFSQASFEGCVYSEVQLFKDIKSRPDIIELQRCVLKDLMGPDQETILDIRKYEDGQRELGDMLKTVPAFIYIDNVLGVNEVGQLLPRDLNAAKKVRLLLTAHDNNVTTACPRNTDVKIYNMKNIPNAQAMQLLKKEDLEEKLESHQLDKIIEICGGNPLMLTLVSKVIRSQEDKQTAYNMVMQDKQKLKGPMLGAKEDYFFVYDSLPVCYTDSFLDVCTFFNGWEWDTVADIVGENALDTLEKRALVSKDMDGILHVQDTILTVGLHKSERTRFNLNNAIQIDQFLKEEKDLQNIKGISLSISTSNAGLISIPASKLDSMYNSLRILSLGNLIKVEGQCNRNFENLVCFQGKNTHLPFHVSKLMELRYFKYEPEPEDWAWALNEMPSEIDGRLHSGAFQIPSKYFQQLGNLRVLKLIKLTKLKTLPEQLGDQVKGLHELSFSHCSSIEELPQSISKLESLRVLRLDYCSSLRELPKKFSDLQSLKVLRMDYCLSLSHLGDNFESLKSLQELNLQGCMGLKQPGTNFGLLNSLQKLNLQGCMDLDPKGLDYFKKLPSLNFLNLSSSLYENLKEYIPRGFVEKEYIPPRFVEEKDISDIQRVIEIEGND